MQNLNYALPSYFKGEFNEAIFFIVPVGLIAVCAGIWLLKLDRSPFIIGFVIPCLLLGSVMVITGSTVALRTENQVASLQQQLAQNPKQFYQEEGTRMAKVNQAWPLYLACWVAFLAIGLVLRFAVKLDWAQGLSISLILFAALGLVIDGFAERRAKPYTQAITASAQLVK
jgi:hypothetical protein